MNKSKRLIVFFYILFLSHWQANSQVDTIEYKVQTQFVTSSQGHLPQWIISNRHGVFKDDTDALLRTGFIVPYSTNKKFGVSFGLDLIGKKDVDDSFIQQGFLKLKYGILELRGGRIEENIGLQDETLSSGSLALSKNARPITKIAVAIPDYINVPFTNEYLKVKGHLGHGWLEDNRFISKPFLHEKSIYFRAGGPLPVNLHLGFAHYVIWGGTSEDAGDLPSSFRDFLRVFVGQEAIVDEKNPFGVDKGNAIGSHLGIYDIGISADYKGFQFLVYNQVPYEDRSSLNIFENKDRLLGISIKNPSKQLFSGVLYEYLHTTYQSGPGIPDPRPGDNNNFGYEYGGRDDNYNNGVYRSGWTFKNRILGTPLFITDARASNFFDDLENYEVSIVNNRVIAHHIGVEGNLSKAIRYKTLATYTKNFGTYAGLNLGRTKWASMDPDIVVDYEFDPPLKQVYLLLELNTKLPFSEHLNLQTAIGGDLGEITDNFGILLGLQWDGLINLAKD